MEYGPEIKRGSDAWPETDVRPVWLADNDKVMRKNPVWGTIWYSVGSVGWPFNGDIIRLPADHWSYKAIVAGFTPCNGKPNDWDGGVIFTCYPGCDGREIVPPIRDEMWSANDPYYAPVRGYHRKSTKQTVTIEMRTEAEWLDWTAARGAQRQSRGSIRFMELVRDLGLVTPPTPLERFMAEHPDADRRTAELALSWSE